MAVNGVTETVYLAVEADNYWRSKPPADDIPPSIPVLASVEILSSSSARLVLGSPSVDSQSPPTFHIGYWREAGDTIWIEGGRALASAGEATVTGLPAGSDIQFTVGGVDSAPIPNATDPDDGNVIEATTAAAPANTGFIVEAPIGGYNIGSDMATQFAAGSLSRSYMCDKDLVIPHTQDITQASARLLEYTLLKSVKDESPWIKFARYQITNSRYKATGAGVTTNLLRFLIEGIATAEYPANEGHPDWDERDTAGNRTTHRFGVTSNNPFWKCVEAVHRAALNTLGEMYTQALFRRLLGYMSINTGGVGTALKDVYDAIYVDDTNMMPQTIYNAAGTAGTWTDVDQDGTAEDPRSNTVGATDALDGGARQHRKGYIHARNHYTARFPGWPFLRNVARDSFDYTDDGATDPPLPLSANEWFQAMHGGPKEFQHSVVGLVNELYPAAFESSGTPGSFKHAFFGFSNFWRDIHIARAMVVPDQDHPWNHNSIIVDVPMAYRKNGSTTFTAAENEFLRFYTGLTWLESGLLNGLVATKKEPVTCDEALLSLEPGTTVNRVPMGVLNPTNNAFSLRTEDISSTTGAGKVWTAYQRSPVDGRGVLMMLRGDSSGLSTNAPYLSGTALRFNAPTPRSGYHWRYANCLTHVCPIKSRPLRGQDPALNNGATVTYVDMKCYTARFLLEVPN